MFLTNILIIEQKCDREQPCGLCKARKVEHLCRWELEPFSRPTPNRPPGAHRAGNKATSPKVQASSEAAESPSGSSETQSSSVATPGLTPAQGKAGLATVDVEVKEAAIALAQLSVARHVNVSLLAFELKELTDPRRMST